MRYILLFWALPMGIFWGWYSLSYNDLHFGYVFFSRQVHDLAFRMYGQILGIAPETIPPLVARACVVDTALIFAIFAFRKRKEIAAWAGRMRERYSSAARAEPRAWSRSSTP